jgi:hypothetical protein
LALERTGVSYPVIWVSADYHTYPDQLKAKLQDEIDNLRGYERVLLVYGCCGNAVKGLKATTAEIVLPKVDDCIELLLRKPAERFERKKRTYFLTKGWLESTRGIMSEHRYMVKRYGESRALKIHKQMLKEYKYLMFIDTGVSDKEDMCNLLKSSGEIASLVDLELIVDQGNLWLLEKLVKTTIDENFLVIPKGETVDTGAFLCNP